MTTEARIYRVSQITRYIKELLEVDFRLQNLWLEGEISNFSQSTAGHAYFTLKDEKSRIRCVMWRSDAEAQTRLPEDGEAVICHGRVSVYEVQGVYQYYVDLIQPAGRGALHMQFEALKRKLEGEGLFAPEHKQSLPPFPSYLGVVTSPTGAALRDILRVLGRRYPLANVLLAPTLVQGEEAPAQIVEAIRDLGSRPEVEAIIVARGGGSLEELWAFNEENVGRAIFASPIPIVSGVGHETDFTIADLIADVRAPTPSAAAELAVPSADELKATIDQRHRQLARRIAERLDDCQQRLAQEERALARLSPDTWVENYRQRVDELARSALSSIQHRLTVQQERVRAASLQLQSLSPRTTLARGYSVTTHGNTGQVVKQVKQVQAGDPIEVQVSDGKFGGSVGDQRDPGA